MEKLSWDPAFSVGNARIDEEHKMLFKIVNMLKDDPHADYTSEIISDLISQTTQYALRHFKSEEEYMASFQYPGLEMHKHEHREFMVKIAEASLLVLQKEARPTDLYDYLTSWITNHVLHSDRKYMQYKETLPSDSSASE